MVSVVIPAYNGADFLGDAVQSVLDQTYSHFEIIVVDDASQDETPQVVGRFSDPRLRYVSHARNLGAVAARRTGTELSSGEIVAYLDQDDLFHPEKLENHVSFLAAHPEVGLTYNARFEVDSASRTIRGMWQPPATLTLADMVVGFPISPSDTVVRRAWITRDELWEHASPETGTVIFNGHEIVMGGRLALAGCGFAGIIRALNYRRYHAERTFSRLEARCRAELECQELIFRDPRCPETICALRDTASANILLVWAYHAFVQHEPDIGERLLREACRRKPTLIEGSPCEFVSALVGTTVSDARGPHEQLLERVFDHLPAEFRSLASWYGWTAARGYLLKGARAVLWASAGEARECFRHAARLNAGCDRGLVETLSADLLGYTAEFGGVAGERVLDLLVVCLKEAGFGALARQVAGNYWMNRGFEAHRAGERRAAAANVARAVKNAPRFAWNRGVLSVLARSLHRS